MPPNPRKSRFPVAGLTACVFGLVLCPLPFLAFGILSDFSPVFSIIMLPPLLLATAFLLLQFVPAENRPARRIPRLILESASWGVIGVFLFLASGVNLAKGVERLGAIGGSFMAASLLFLPVVLRRRTGLEERLASVPRGVALGMMVLLLAFSGTSVILSLLVHPAFVG